MGRRGYNGYRGKGAVQKTLHVMLVLLVVVVLLAAAGLLLGQRYIIYADDGVRLELPFFQREEPPAVDADVSLEVHRPEMPWKDRPGGQPDIYG